MTLRYQTPLAATIAGIRDLFGKKAKVGETTESDRLDDKTVLIDGASSGLGLATAVELARRGARIVMAVRSGIPQKGEEVKKRSGSHKVDMLPVDFSSIRSIDKLVDVVKSTYGQVDIVISNAAVVNSKARMTPDGLDQMFMVNYLSKFIYLNRLLERGCLRTDGPEPPRIVITASESHRNAREFAWDQFGVYKEFPISETVAHYGYTKLLLVTFANELSRRLNPDGKLKVAVSSLCPGPVNSNIAREAPAWVLPLLKLVFRIFFRSPEKACETVVYLAASRDAGKMPMDYLFLMSRKPMDEKAVDPANGMKLWTLSEDLARRIRR
jgi:NAD(P)-dependent dehydrogenase (short-subunit alcohol dehydrogenase family)